MGTNDASFNDGTGIGAVLTNAHLSTTAGALGGAWQSWTPTLTNLSGGTITFAKYIQVGKTVFFRFKYTLAGAGVSGSVTMSLPVTANYSDNDVLLNGTVLLNDTGTAAYVGVPRLSNSTTLLIQTIGAAGTYANLASLSSTVPHTWASTDVISVACTYEAA